MWLLFIVIFRYGTVKWYKFKKEQSGAYLFLPDGDSMAVQIENTIVKVIEGPILSSVNVHLPYVQHSVYLYNTPGNLTFKKS